MHLIMDEHPVKRKYEVTKSKQRWESTPVRKKKEKNERLLSTSVNADLQHNYVTPRPKCCPLVSYKSTPPSLKKKKKDHQHSPKMRNQHSSPVTPTQQHSLTSPLSANKFFISGREFLAQQSNSSMASTPKRVNVQNTSTRNDFFQLNESDLMNFDPDQYLSESKQPQNWMSDDSALENFDLEEVISECKQTVSSNFNDSLSEEPVITDSEMNRSWQIRKKLGLTSRKHDKLRKSITYSESDADSWEVSVFTDANKSNSHSPAPIQSKDNCVPNVGVNNSDLELGAHLNHGSSNSLRVTACDTNKPNPSSHKEEAKTQTNSAIKASTSSKKTHNRNKMVSATLILSQHDANSWAVSPSALGTCDSSMVDRGKFLDSGLGSSIAGKDDLASDKSINQLSLGTEKTLNGLTSELMFNKKLREDLKANARKINPPARERCIVLTKEDEFFGLPNQVKLLISKYKGIVSLYPWQEECLNLEAVQKRKNLIYALPTSGGKTLVAEILMLKEIICREKNVIFILPYVSIVQEKVRALSPFGVELGFLVEEYAAGKGAYPPTKRLRKRTVYVATIEKASGLVNSLFETGRLEDEIGLICIDELHLIGEPRGAILESCLTKIMYKNLGLHIIGMSATIGNLSELAHFLNAEIFTQDFRPVELTEFVKCGSKVFSMTKSIEGNHLTFNRDVKLEANDPDYVAGLVKETIPDDSCLVFCASKKNCENVALLICKASDKSLKESRKKERSALFRALAAEGNGIVCKILGQTIPFGVAYHHSGLTVAERKLLEEAFCAGTICCICCTSTLAAGVNLPAKRVIIRSPYVGNKFITFSQYKQMIGRAGRAGFGKEGESFLLCQPNDTEKVMTLINSKVNSCDSQLSETNSLPTLILSAVGLELATKLEQLKLLFKSTLLHAQKHFDMNVDTFLEDAIKDMCNEGALVTKSKDEDSEYQLSRLGKAAIKGSITIDEAKKLDADLRLALKCVSLSNYLHRLYLITPYSMSSQIPIQRDVYFSVYMALNEQELEVARIIGINDGCIMKYMSGRKSMDGEARIMERFYQTLILHSLWEGKNVWDVAAMFNISRGLVHSFLQSAASFNSSVIRFCEEMSEFNCVAVLLKEMSPRLIHCCSAELLPLMELPSVKLGRAKQLMKAGFKNLQIIATSDVHSMVSKIDHLPKRVAYQIIAAAKMLLLAKAELLQEEAEQVLEGLEGIKLQ